MTISIGLKINKIISVFYPVRKEVLQRFTFDASKPTIRKWREIKNYPIKQHHLDRIETLYEAAQFWEDKDLGTLFDYTYLNVGPENVSLSYILREKPLNIDKIKDRLDMIASIIVAKAKAYEARQTRSEKVRYDHETTK